MLHELKPVAGARSTRKRVGRGPGSGLGKTSGKGHKGQNARSGGGTRPGFEGGQLPLFQSIPKRGFKNINRKEYACVNLGDLNRFDEGTVVTLELLLENRMVSKPEAGLKILANGELDKKLVIKANKFSKSALEAIEKAGGTAEVI